MTTHFFSNTQYILEQEDLQQLIVILQDRGYRVIGPTLGESTITYDEIASISDLPAGWSDQQEGGEYRLIKREDDALFGYTLGPQSWKRFLHPPEVRLWTAKRSNGAFDIYPNDEEVPKLAFLGVRACELQAIMVQDKVFMHGEFVDATYHARRKQSFIIAVNCGQANNNCFCTSMDSGPKAYENYDIALTEILHDEQHYFVAEIGSEKGAEIINQLSPDYADDSDITLAEQVVENAIAHIKRNLEIDGLHDALNQSYESRRWDSIGHKCLSCGNCTMVCPTCFCTTIEDETSLTGDEATRIRRWDSCHTMDFSYIHGGSTRYSSGARYRQWLMHKLSTWNEQFDTLGCVGCGRCITWCPVGIDIVQEAQKLHETSLLAKE